MTLYDIVEYKGFGVMESPIVENKRVTKNTLEEAITYWDENRKDKGLSWMSFQTPYTYQIQSHSDGKFLHTYNSTELAIIIANNLNKNKEVNIVEMEVIDSGDIHSIGYDKHNNSLYITFKNGNGIYKSKYLDVPKEVFITFKNARNRYAFFHGQIKRSYKSKDL